MIIRSQIYLSIAQNIAEVLIQDERLNFRFYEVVLESIAFREHENERVDAVTTPALEGGGASMWVHEAFNRSLFI